MQPDLLVVLDPQSVTERAIERAPALAVEILSPSSQRRDRMIKRERYARSGVREYWVVDPQARTVEQSTLSTQGELQLAAILGERDRLRSTVLPDLECSVAAVFPEGLEPAP